MELIKITDEELKQIQSKSLDIVKYTAELCKEHDVKFFLYGGSVIGALREHGFVPWDDDMDIKFTPPEYEKFRKVWEEYADKECKHELGEISMCKSEENCRSNDTEALIGF